MATRKPKSIRVIAGELNLSLSQINQARKAGIDPRNRKAMLKWRKGIRPRVDARKELSEPEKPDRPTAKPGEMTLDEIESALKAPGISVTEATTLKRQLEGLKLSANVRREMNQLIPRAEIEQQGVRIGSAIAALCRKLENEIPPLVLGLPLERARPLVKEKVRELQAVFANEMSEFWNQHQET